MKSMRLLRSTAVAQLFEARPAVFRQTVRQLQQTSQQAFRTRPALQNTRSLHTQRRPTAQTFSQAFRTRRTPHNSSSKTSRRYNSSTSTAGESSANLSFSQRMKKLSREYGWSALGVYLFLTALDFPFCFLAVRLLGTDRIGHWEHVILETLRGLFKWPLPQQVKEQLDVADDVVQEKVTGGLDGDKRILEESSAEYRKDDIEDHGYKEAERANQGANASIWTQLGLAYVIHKSFIFVRVPLTAAVTPKVVKTLRSWGWNIGKMPARKPISSSSTAGVNTKGSKVKPDD